jgi:hypothetical protein
MAGAVHCVGSESGRPGCLFATLFVVSFLAFHMALCGRISFQPGMLDRLAAAHADAITASGYTAQRFIEISELLLVAADVGADSIHRLIGDGVVTSIARFARELQVLFSGRSAVTRFLQLLPQLFHSIAELLLEVRQV